MLPSIMDCVEVEEKAQDSFEMKRDAHEQHECSASRTL
jgi:hypothetical protein